MRDRTGWDVERHGIEIDALERELKYAQAEMLGGIARAKSAILDKSLLMTKIDVMEEEARRAKKRERASAWLAFVAWALLGYLAFWGKTC